MQDTTISGVFGFDPSEENNLSELLNLDKTALETEHQKNENRLQEFEQEISVLNQELGRLDQSLNDLKQDTGNHSSRAVLSTTLIECKSLVHDFIQHALAKIVLKETIRNFNEKFANPILTRAQAHFQCLTDNSFAGIMTDQESKSFSNLLKFPKLILSDYRLKLSIYRYNFFELKIL